MKAAAREAEEPSCAVCFCVDLGDAYKTSFFVENPSDRGEHLKMAAANCSFGGGTPSLLQRNFESEGDALL